MTFLGLSSTRSQRCFLERSRTFWPTILQQSPRPFNTDLCVLPCVSHCHTPERLLPLSLLFTEYRDQSGALTDKVIGSYLLQPVRPTFTASFSPLLHNEHISEGACHWQIKGHRTYRRAFLGGLTTHPHLLSWTSRPLTLGFHVPSSPSPTFRMGFASHILSSAISIDVC